MVATALEDRYRALRRALEGLDPEIMRPLSFNSGCFVLLELPSGIDPEVVRRALLREQDTGVVAIRPSYLRLAYCSVAEEAIPELVSRVENGVKAALALGRPPRAAPTKPE